jgi:hypothetical protein
MFIKFLGIGVLAVSLFALLTLLLMRSSENLGSIGLILLGLIACLLVAALFDGVCAVESKPGRGTTVRVTIPLREEELCLSAS